MFIVVYVYAGYYWVNKVVQNENDITKSHGIGAVATTLFPKYDNANKSINLNSNFNEHTKIKDNCNILQLNVCIGGEAINEDTDDNHVESLDYPKCRCIHFDESTVLVDGNNVRYTIPANTNAATGYKGRLKPYQLKGCKNKKLGERAILVDVNYSKIHTSPIAEFIF